MADAYDFQIESMKFRLATHDNAPYVRSTAPFRKDQFDSSPTVGDQSLTGWWTRGQLSFHMGAGLKYYEVLEGEEVLNRFDSASNVRVFQELGEVSLGINPTATAVAGLGTDIRDACPWGSQGAFVTAAFDGFKFLSSPDAASATSVTLDTGVSTIDSITTLGNYVFGVSDTEKVYRWHVSVLGTPVALYTSANDIYKVWGGKNRLWIVENTGKVYAVSGFPATPPVALSSPICTFDNLISSQISFTDGGGSVFCSIGREHIYAFTPEADGTVAVLSAPVVAAIMPPNEYVVCIRAHMGILVIATNRGLRCASIDGATLTVGPHIVTWKGCDTRSIGVQDSRVYVAGLTNADLDDIVIYELELSESQSGNPLVFPYNEWHRHTQTYYGAGHGVLEHGYTGDSTVSFYYDDGGTLYRTANQTNLCSTGYVVSGYHRFGTLDPKRFQKVTVRAKGSGTIQVYEVTADGTETSLGTLNASAGTGTYDFATTTPVERMALKFVLNRDGTDATAGPTLLGYQIKALPVPERQRLIKVPLLLVDEFTLRRGTRVGHKGKAYEDAAELEALESSQAIVTFTDHRTGETGSAYIDSVDFQGDTPASESSSGFGGIAYVTLRVLS